MRVMIRGNWAPYVGTDYCYPLGVYDSLADAATDGEATAWENWQPDEDSDFEDEGPDYWLEEYDPEIHDGLEAGGDGRGSGFKRFFEREEKSS